MLQDTKIVARIGIGYANEYLSPLISGMSAKIFMKKYGVKLLEAGLHGPGYVKVIAAAGLGVTAALGISEGLNATSVALGNESLSQANVLTNGLAGYGGMKAASALEARFANTKGLGKLAVGVTTGATEWSTYDLGKTNPFTTNDSIGRNYTVGETLGTLRRDLLGNAFFGLGGHVLGMAGKATGSAVGSAGKGAWNVGRKFLVRSAPAEAEAKAAELTTLETH